MPPRKQAMMPAPAIHFTKPTMLRIFSEPGGAWVFTLGIAPPASTVRWSSTVWWNISVVVPSAGG